MDRKFINVVDQDVACTYVYADSTGKACSDSEGTNQLTTSVLADLFYKGCVIVADSVEYLPVSLKIDSGIATVTYVTTDSSAATTAKLATVVSKAD